MDFNLRKNGVHRSSQRDIHYCGGNARSDKKCRDKSSHEKLVQPVIGQDGVETMQGRLSHSLRFIFRMETHAIEMNAYRRKRIIHIESVSSRNIRKVRR